MPKASGIHPETAAQRLMEDAVNTYLCQRYPRLKYGEAGIARRVTLSSIFVLGDIPPLTILPVAMKVICMGESHAIYHCLVRLPDQPKVIAKGEFVHLFTPTVPTNPAIDQPLREALSSIQQVHDGST